MHIINIRFIKRTHFIKSHLIKKDVTKIGLTASHLIEFEVINSKFNKI